MNAHELMLTRQRTTLGALMLTALGVLMLAHNALPVEQHDSPLHAALILGSVAAVFGAVFAFGYGGRRWAHVPAIFFGSVAGVVLFASYPWHWIVGFGLPLWPLVLIIVGLWLVRRDRSYL